MHRPALLIALLLPLSAMAQPPAPPLRHAPTAPDKQAEEAAARKELFNSLDARSRSILTRHAPNYYRMPDGSYWDGWGYKRMRDLLDHNLVSMQRVHREMDGPIFHKAVVDETYWEITPSPEARAWRLPEYLPRGPDLEQADRMEWKGAPPIWRSTHEADYFWVFSFIEQDDLDPYTSCEHGTYIEITREWGGGQYDVKGYSLDGGRFEGLLNVTDSKHLIGRKFIGKFFLWPGPMITDPGAVTRPSWKLLGAASLRVTPEELAEAVMRGDAEIVEWKHRFTGEDRVLWTRQRIEITAAQPGSDAPPRAAPPGPQADNPADGPDLLVLNTGKWYRGRLVRRDDKQVVFATKVGGIDAELTFRPDEVGRVEVGPAKPDKY